MPFYEYRCQSCGHQDSFLESMKAGQVKTCPQCKKRRAFKRLISAAGFQLKGQGWYATDFKDKPKPPKESKDAPNDKKSADAPAQKSEKSEKSEKSDSTTTKKADKSDGKKTDKKAD